MNMTVNIYDWNAVDMTELFLDGNQYLMLGRSENTPNDEREVWVYRNTGSEDKMEMRTNIALDRFELALTNDGEVDEDNPRIIRNDRFEVELVTEDGLNYFVFTALQPYDAAATDNPSILTVTAGRLTFDITIHQADANPGDWIDGGNYPQELPGKNS
jgi:hypothetical protein